MKNLISMVEIPVSDFPRAIKFYTEILDISIEEIEWEGTKMGIMSVEEGSVNVMLVKGSDYKPSKEGAIVYFMAGNDLQPVLDKVESNGGKIILSKTEISPEMGYFALFMDSEGNKIGLHSI